MSTLLNDPPCIGGFGKLVIRSTSREFLVQQLDRLVLDVGNRYTRTDKEVSEKYHLLNDIHMLRQFLQVMKEC